MANVKYANNAVTTLASGITAVATSMTVASATAFPTLAAGEYFYCTLTDAATSLVIEIVKVTAVSGTTFTITRAQDGTTASAYILGDNVQLRLTRANLLNFPLLNEANSFSSTGIFSIGTNQFYKDASGNVGIGVIPSAWDATYKVAQVSNGSLASSTSSTRLGNNYYYSGGYKYAATATSGLYSIDGNSHAWYIAPSGTAGTAITFTTAMTIFATGGLSLGNTTDPGATNLSVTGTTTSTGGIVSTTLNNTNTITVKGSLFTLQDDTDTTKQANFVLSSLTTGTTYSYKLPVLSGSTLAVLGLAQTWSALQTFSGALTVSSGNFTISSAGGGIQATTQTTGSSTIGGASQTGTLTFGQSTVSQIVNISNGATASGSTKTINIGTGGLAGSTTNIAIGSTTGTSTTTVNGLLKQQTYTVATLPSAATSGTGARSFVTDALAPAFGATVVTGGAVAVPVYSDGTNWKVG